MVIVGVDTVGSEDAARFLMPTSLFSLAAGVQVRVVADLTVLVTTDVIENIEVITFLPTTVTVGPGGMVVSSVLVLVTPFGVTIFVVAVVIVLVNRTLTVGIPAVYDWVVVKRLSSVVVTGFGVEVTRDVSVENRTVVLETGFGVIIEV